MRCTSRDRGRRGTRGPRRSRPARRAGRCRRGHLGPEFLRATRHAGGAVVRDGDLVARELERICIELGGVGVVLDRRGRGGARGGGRTAATDGGGASARGRRRVKLGALAGPLARGAHRSPPCISTKDLDQATGRGRGRRGSGRCSGRPGRRARRGGRSSRDRCPRRRRDDAGDGLAPARARGSTETRPPRGVNFTALTSEVAHALGDAGRVARVHTGALGQGSTRRARGRRPRPRCAAPRRWRAPESHEVDPRPCAARSCRRRGGRRRAGRRAGASCARTWRSRISRARSNAGSGDALPHHVRRRCGWARAGCAARGRAWRGSRSLRRSASWSASSALLALGDVEERAEQRAWGGGSRPPSAKNARPQRPIHRTSPPGRSTRYYHAYSPLAGGDRGPAGPPSSTPAPVVGVDAREAGLVADVRVRGEAPELAGAGRPASSGRSRVELPGPERLPRPRGRAAPRSCGGRPRRASGSVTSSRKTRPPRRRRAGRRRAGREAVAVAADDARSLRGAAWPALQASSRMALTASGGAVGARRPSCARPPASSPALTPRSARKASFASEMRPARSKNAMPTTPPR